MDIKLIAINKPPKGKTAKDIEWICNTLGLSSGRDIEGNANKIVEDILKKISSSVCISSDSIAKDLKLSQGQVNHHLRNLSQLGIVARNKNQICLQGGSLSEAIRQVRRNADSIFDDLERIAKDVDESLGIVVR